VRDDLPEDALRERIALANQYRIERVGQELKLDMLAMRSVSRDANAFTRAVQLAKELTNLPLILIAEEPALLAAGAELVTERKPLLFGANSENIAEMVAVAKEAACALVLSAEKLDQLAELAEKAKAAGLRELVLHPAARELHESLETFTRIRRLAVKKNFRPLGYPTLAVIDTADSAEALVQASICTMKYCSVVVFEDVSWDILLPLFALRQNIFTDPQKPIQVKPGVYEIGTPNENSPLLVTTNFSLTYFTVAGDIEKSKMPAWLLVADTEGLSVMTAFAADKFTPDCVKKLIDDTAIASRLSHRKLIIPGMVAPMTIKLKELTGFEILVGPRDSAGIPAFLEETWKL
jgi:acetyl-CoA decarbonylase/synthase complex subunit gamma